MQLDEVIFLPTSSPTTEADGSRSLRTPASDREQENQRKHQDLIPVLEKVARRSTLVDNC